MITMIAGKELSHAHLTICDQMNHCKNNHYDGLWHFIWAIMYCDHNNYYDGEHYILYSIYILKCFVQKVSKIYRFGRRF